MRSKNQLGITTNKQIANSGTASNVFFMLYKYSGDSELLWAMYSSLDSEDL